MKNNRIQARATMTPRLWNGALRMIVLWPIASDPLTSNGCVCLRGHAECHGESSDPNRPSLEGVTGEKGCSNRFSACPTAKP